VERWVRRIRERDRELGHRRVHQYILDNEPMLWHETHRDVRSDPVTYDELLEKTIAYASAIRRADPEATIAGPAAWGWLEVNYSAVDVAAGLDKRPDRLRHGDAPLLAWYLRQLRAHERRTGKRLLDVVDVHYYPALEGIGLGTSGETDPETAALRIRSTRSLWDPEYVDESWIRERFRVIPRLRGWIAESYSRPRPVDRRVELRGRGPRAAGSRWRRSSAAGTEGSPRRTTGRTRPTALRRSGRSAPTGTRRPRARFLDGPCGSAARRRSPRCSRPRTRRGGASSPCC
jgi:hypothetical protein